MRSFTSYLRKSARQEWQEYYLDYVSLKSLLEKFADRRSRLTDDTDLDTIEKFFPEADTSASFEPNKRKEFGFGDFNLMSPSSQEKDSTSKFVLRSVNRATIS